MLTDDEVKDRAAKWARLHRKPETRTKMDECLAGISQADQRRVYLCGQRIAAGMDAKVIPAPASTTTVATKKAAVTKEKKKR